MCSLLFFRECSRNVHVTCAQMRSRSTPVDPKFVRVQNKHSPLTPVDPSAPSQAACLLLLQPGCMPASLSARLPASLSVRLPACFSACCKTFGACRELCFFMLLLLDLSARRLNHDLIDDGQTLKKLLIIFLAND